MPGLFIILNLVTDTGTKLIFAECDYENEYNLLLGNGYMNTVKPKALELPEPQKMQDILKHFVGLDESIDFKALLKQFQQGMFLVVMLFSFFEVVVPACANAVVYRDQWNALKTIVWGCVRSLILIAIFHLLIKNAYFVDTSNPVGLVTLFLFVVSISLSQKAIDPLKAKKN
ncbi:MAG: hypothetical protein KAW19_12615 [Candidatus Aminicenantes bacterium]|nr:hypothetical protein [Candidatus Aminicenantes bacterium]